MILSARSLTVPFCCALQISYGLHFGGFVIGFLFSIAGVRNLSKTNLERTYIIPTATWLLFAFCLLLVGWFISSAPPTSLRLLNAPSKLPPCCWRAWECELQREDLDFFDCDGGSEGSVRGVGGSSGGGFYLFEGGSRLVAAAGATARVKDQSCGALLQYVGLQIGECGGLESRTNKPSRTSRTAALNSTPACSCSCP